AVRLLPDRASSLHQVGRSCAPAGRRLGVHTAPGPGRVRWQPVWREPRVASILSGMVRLSRGLAVALIASLLLVPSAGADTRPPEIYPLDKVRRGQRGYGL